jgi:tRNA nucleotidyltransferase (CCA-adding enzyme)
MNDGDGGARVPEVAESDGRTEPREAKRLEAPPAVIWIVQTLEDHGFETWTVGGAVRDALLGRPSGDWDLATRARPRDMQRIFKRTVPVGVDHGTVGVVARDGIMYEVTTFRRDVETDGRHAVVSFSDRIEEDLARRDFTINAIAWHPLTRRLLDPFRGRDDLEAGLVRTVGEPAERFDEDYLRVLRAFRFAGRFGLRVEDATWEAIRAVVDRLPGLSAERIRDELIKVLDTDTKPSIALGLYLESGALAVLYPELAARTGVPAVGPDEPASTSTTHGGVPTEWDVHRAAADSLPTGNATLRLAALLHGLEHTDAAALLMRLRLSNEQTDRTLRMATTAELPAPDAPDADFRRWLSRTGPDVWPAAARLQLAVATTRYALGLTDEAADERLEASWLRARAIHDQKPPLTVGDLDLDGRDLIALGLKPGPRFGSILEGLLEWVLDDPSRNRHDVLVDRVLKEVSDG